MFELEEVDSIKSFQTDLMFLSPYLKGPPALAALAVVFANSKI